MHSLDESGYEKRARAGLIPFIKVGGEVRYLMMVSSDPKFGGPRPMISKGKIEDSDTSPLAAAIREAEEELGFKQRNMRGEYLPIFEGRVELFSGAYTLTVFGCEIQDRYDFDKWCDETEYTEWMSLEDFQTRGRRDHVKFLEELERRVS
jgi:8-oxo-dGTP pyrophosphatase MutT (NUDIX family)